MLPRYLARWRYGDRPRPLGELCLLDTCWENFILQPTDDPTAVGAMAVGQLVGLVGLVRRSPQ